MTIDINSPYFSRPRLAKRLRSMRNGPIDHTQKSIKQFLIDIQKNEKYKKDKNTHIKENTLEKQDSIEFIQTQFQQQFLEAKDIKTSQNTKILTEYFQKYFKEIFLLNKKKSVMANLFHNNKSEELIKLIFTTPDFCFGKHIHAFFDQSLQTLKTRQEDSSNVVPIHSPELILYINNDTNTGKFIHTTKNEFIDTLFKYYNEHKFLSQ
jgi:hypothetical protein